MEFSANNRIVQLCLQGMGWEDKGNAEEAAKGCEQAWSDAADDFEKYLADFYLARHKENIADKLKWIETSLQLALKINNDAVVAAYPLLYENIAKCYDEINDADNAKKNYALAEASKNQPE